MLQITASWTICIRSVSYTHLNKIAAMAAQVKELAEDVEKWKHKYQKTKQAYNQIQRELDLSLIHISMCIRDRF